MKSLCSRYTIAIGLISCSLQGQQLQLQLPFEAKIALDSMQTAEKKNTWSFSVDDSSEHWIRILRNDSIICSKKVQLSANETRVYVLEKNDLNGYQLFYRNLPLREIEATHFDQTLSVLPPLNDNGENDIQSTEVSDTLSKVPVLVSVLNETVEMEDRQESFEDAMIRIKDIQYEFERSTEIISWSENYGVSLFQITEFSSLLSYDPSKLMLLQRLYPLCTEQNEYEILSEVFKYENFKSQFQEWLSLQNRQ